MRHDMKLVAKNTFLGMTAAVWFIIGGVMASMTGWGIVFGVPMILFGLFFPIYEAVLGWRGESWVGECDQCGATTPEGGACSECQTEEDLEDYLFRAA